MRKLFSLIFIFLCCVSAQMSQAGTANSLPPNSLPPIEELHIANQASLLPSFYEIQAISLNKILKQYQEIASNGGWGEWQTDKKLQEGESDARVPALRNILTIMGDYPSASGVKSESLVYDAILVEAVKKFQERHGLNADGKLGKSSQKALAVPVNKRITQILLTLQKLHTYPTTSEEKFILVNLPAYRLYGIEEGKEKLTMRVIIGNVDHKTPTFDNAINNVVFNPPWNVPSKIARNEMVPKLKKNPNYFIKSGFVVTQNGVEIDPMDADFDSGGFSFRQRAGSSNALGKIKFNMPDSDSIYLHSTSSPKLFEKEERAMSHGCVRLEKPRELAHFVIASVEGWQENRIDKAYDSSKEGHVKINQFPVHLVYWTAFVDSKGNPNFYEDVYKQDNLSEASLNETHDEIVVSVN